MRQWMNTLVEEVSAWPEVSVHEHRFGGVEFRMARREIGHVHWFGIVDIPFTVKIRDALIQAGRAEQHHFVPDSGWTTVRVNKHGKDNARGLLRLSYLKARMKNNDAAVVDAARMELEQSGLEPEILEAAGVPVAATAARG